MVFSTKRIGESIRERNLFEAGRCQEIDVGLAELFRKMKSILFPKVQVNGLQFYSFAEE